MSKLFSLSEIVQIGIQIEKNGQDFYHILGESSRSNEVKGIFHYLEEEEKKHIGVFNDILNHIEDYKPKEAYPAEYFSFLAALSTEYVFTQARKGAEIAQKIRDDKEAIELGIKFEKESILFYHEMKRVVWQDSQYIIEKLIDQERKHLTTLLEIKMGLGSV